MKQKILITGFTLFLASSFFSNVMAQTKTPTLTPKVTESTTRTRNSPTPVKSEPTATEAADLNRIQKIKDLVASRVAELKLVEKRGILGTVKETSTSQVTVRDNKGDQRVIDIDELTKFQGNTSTSSKDDDEDESFGISDIEVGDEVAFVGLYNKQTDRLLARVVLIPKSIPFYMDGVISDIDLKAFTFSVSNDDEKRVVDFEKSTTAKLYTKADGIKKSGFTTLEDGQRAIVVGFEDDKNKHIIATRVLHFSDILASEEMKKGLSLEAEEASPSSTVTPTKRVLR